MKIIANIPGFSVIARGLLKVRKYNHLIDGARAAGELEKEQQYIKEAVYDFSSYVSESLDLSFNVIHPENLPQSGPAVYIANHQSYADILAFMCCVRNHQLAYIAKDTLEKIPVFGKWVKRIRGIFIHRGDARSSLATINEGADYLKQGFSLVIFPEGTRSHGSQIAAFKPGSFKLATKARVPIVPISLNRGYHIFEDQGVLTKHHSMEFLVHPPIETAGMDRHQLAELPQQVEEIVRQGVAELQEMDHKEMDHE